MFNATCKIIVVIVVIIVAPTVTSYTYLVVVWHDEPSTSYQNTPQFVADTLPSRSYGTMELTGLSLSPSPTGWAPSLFSLDLRSSPICEVLLTSRAYIYFPFFFFFPILSYKLQLFTLLNDNLLVLNSRVNVREYELLILNAFFFCYFIFWLFNILIYIINYN